MCTCGISWCFDYWLLLDYTVSAAIPIEVEFIIAGVVDVGDSLNEVSSVSTVDLQPKTTG